MSEHEPRVDQQSRQQAEQDQVHLEEQGGRKPRVLTEESQGGELLERRIDCIELTTSAFCQIEAAAQYFKRRLRILEITSDNSWGMARNASK